MKTRITGPYTRGKWHIALLSMIVFIPIGLAIILLSILLAPLGLLLFPLGFIVFSAAFSPLVKTATCQCPHCENVVRVARKTKKFKCSHCKRKIVRVNDTLEAF